ncbi:hypothetical protein SeLEV6574_g07760, partial [Synchytrium endobioticum]
MAPLLWHDQLEIEQLQGEIRIAEAEYHDARILKIDPKDQQGATLAAHQREVARLKDIWQLFQRDLRAFSKKAQARAIVEMEAIKKEIATPGSSIRPPSNPNTVVERPIHRDVLLPDPSKFKGDMASFETWKAQVLNVMEGRTCYTTDVLKIIYVGSLMEDAALAWFQLRQNQRTLDRAISDVEASSNELLVRQNEYRYFLSDMVTKFSDPLRVQKSRKALVL